MSTVAITDPVAEQTRWHKLFKFAPLVIILMYLRTRTEKPVTQIEISERFDIDRKTAAACLRQLTSYGMVAHVDHNSGYVLAEGGQQMLLDLDAGWGKNGHPPLKESFNLKDLRTKTKKEGKKQMRNFWTAPEGLTTERILAETGQLFGFETISFGVSDRDPGLTMALVAHAYDQRARLAKPQIFVYRRLQKNGLPDKKYLVDPLQYLPNPYLHALGLAELAVIEAEESEADLVDEEVHPEAVSKAAGVWWQVQSQLQMEMPRAAFDTWVRDAEAVSLDDQTLQIAVSNEYARDWLENRLTSTINRMLVGILNRSDLLVKFVVGVAVETEA